MATFFKVGTTALVLALIEDDAFGGLDLTLANPVKAIHQVSYDLSLGEPARDGRRADGHGARVAVGAVRACSQVRRGPRSRVRGDETSGGTTCAGGSTSWNGLEPIDTVVDQVDWAAKLQLIEAYRDRHGLDGSDQRLAALDLQYHDLRPERSLFARLDTDHLVERDEVLAGVVRSTSPDQRFFRGQCLRRWASSVASANWDRSCSTSVPIHSQRVLMMDPLRGTAEHTEELLQGSSSVAELLTRFGAAREAGWQNGS